LIKGQTKNSRKTPIPFQFSDAAPRETRETRETKEAKEAKEAPPVVRKGNFATSNQTVNIYQNISKHIKTS
jgi:hypothetical protein